MTNIYWFQGKITFQFGSLFIQLRFIFCCCISLCVHCRLIFRIVSVTDNTQNPTSGSNQQQNTQPVGVVQQPIRTVNPIHARRMMWPGARRHFMGARPPQPAVHRSATDASGIQIPVAPIPFYPYPVPSFVAHPPDIQAEGDQPDDSQDNDQPGRAERKVTGPNSTSRVRGSPRRLMGRPRHAFPGGDSADGADAAAVQHAMSAYWLIWSWLTQLHNTYDLNITLSAKPTSARLPSQEEENQSTGHENAEDRVPKETEDIPENEK